MFRKTPYLKIKRPRINHQIRVPQVRLIDPEGRQLGIVSTSQALAQAQQLGLDLVEVASQARPPVCRLIDFGKYQYKQTKKLRKQKVRSKKGEIKGVRLGLATASHDLEIKAQQVKKFLNKGNKVKIELVLTGRQKGQKDLAQEKIRNFLLLFNKDSLKIIQPLKRNPRGLEIIVDKS